MPKQPKKRKRQRSLPSARHKQPSGPHPVDLGSHSGPLRLVAFSDYRVQDVELLIEELSRLRPAPDLILYGGDDAERFRPSGGANLFEVLASCARYGLCAVAGNDDARAPRALVHGRSVYDVHRRPITVGDFAVLGIDGAPDRVGLQAIGCNLHSEREIRDHIRAQAGSVRGKTLVILSHAPPEGALDQAQRFSPSGEPRSIGSRALKRFIAGSRNVSLVVCGHVHRCGGQHKTFHRALVVNCANHDDFKAVGRYAILDQVRRGKPRIEWRQIREAGVVPGVGEASAARLRQAGIRTVEELAKAPPELLSRIPYLGHSREVLKARALALTIGAPVLLRRSGMSVGSCLFLDIETDLAQSYVWLIGLSGRGGVGCKQFFAETPGGERNILSQFLQAAGRLPRTRILTLSGSDFERRVICKRMAHYGLPTDACRRIEDLYWRIQMTVALPTYSYRVKEIGEFFGYQYKHPNLDGFRVASLYERDYQAARRSSRGRKLAQKLLEYNRDDTLCLPHIIHAIQVLGLRHAEV